MADKLRALELHSKLVGDFEPERVAVETGPTTLDEIRERANKVASGLDLIARRAAHAREAMAAASNGQSNGHANGTGTAANGNGNGNGNAQVGALSRWHSRPRQ